jgi:Zn-dependent peptidase ImmA (M78 family)
VFYYLHEKYDNSISTFLNRFEISLCKIESIEIYFFSLFFSGYSISVDYDVQINKNCVFINT